MLADTDEAGDLVACERVSLRLGFLFIGAVSLALWWGIGAAVAWVFS